MKIVLAEKVSPATLAVFQAEPGWNVVTHDQIKNGLANELKDADGLVVRSAVQVDDALLEHAPKLRVIGRAGVGVDNIDADAATRRGIVVMNTPGANAIAVAELTIALDAGAGAATAEGERRAASGQVGEEVAAAARNCAARRWRCWAWAASGLRWRSARRASAWR